jgi:RNA polymerase sigma-70 factor (ECF subfamily)
MENGTNSEVEDMQLVQACLDGNTRAQNQLFEKYSGQMMALCLRYGSDYDEAQDMFQNGFIKVFKKLHMFTGKGALGAWIRRTMANNALDQIRKRKREKNNVSFSDVSYQLESEVIESPFDDEEPLLSRDKIMELVQQMPTGYKTVFNMYVVEEYSHKEIAEQLEITESTSKTQYRKAKGYMRQLITEELKNTQIE